MMRTEFQKSHVVYRYVLATISLVALTSTFSGCRESPNNSGQSASEGSGSQHTTVAIPGPAELDVTLGDAAETDANLEEGLPEPETGTPEWSLREIAILRGTPLVPESETDPVSEQELHDREVDRERKIVSLATSIIAETHSDKERERLFNAGVHALSESRLKLALKGDQDQIDAMYDDAASLFKRDHESVAAVTAAYSLIRLAEEYTQRIPSSESWRAEYVKQVRLFAKSFPNEESRAVVGLTSAGQLCEEHGQLQQAAACYNTIIQQYPHNAFAAQAQATLRRLNLVGKPLDLAGPTIEGGYVSMDELKDKVVLVVFWTANSEVFAEDWKTIDSVYRQYEQQGFEVVGVNLDRSEIEVDQFLEKHGVKGQHIFFLQEGKRGLSNPVARYYDVSAVPTYWLVNRGTVASTTVQPVGLQPSVEQLLSNSKTAAGEKPLAN